MISRVLADNMQGGVRDASRPMVKLDVDAKVSIGVMIWFITVASISYTVPCGDVCVFRAQW